MFTLIFILIFLIPVFKLFYKSNDYVKVYDNEGFNNDSNAFRNQQIANGL